MTTEQKLREAFEARMTDNGKWPRAVEQGRNGCYLLAQTENAWAEWQACAEALATTEPEPTGMPELPPLPRCMYPNMQYQRMYVGSVYTVDQMRDYARAALQSSVADGPLIDEGSKPTPSLHPVAHIEIGDDFEDVVTVEQAQAYAADAVLAEREACAKVRDERADSAATWALHREVDEATKCAAAIRARNGGV